MTRSSNIITAVAAAILMAATPAMAQTAQQMRKLSPGARVQMQAAHSTDDGRMVQAYITADDDADWHRLDSLGVKITMKLDGVATARIPAAKLAEVAATRGVTYVQTATKATQMLDVARPEAGADKVAAGTGLDRTYTGSGVVVGIVDAGFDYTHAAFRDKDGRLRISRVWEQSSEPYNDYKSPEKYGYGIELDTPELIEGAGGDIRNNSHGTHVTGIAAGSDTYMDGALQGVAPEADIVLVSMGEASRDNVNLTNAIAYIFDYAGEQGKPCVVNLSLGNHAGPHDGTSTFDVIADMMQGEGRLIIGSAGNHGCDKFHVGRTFENADDAQLRTFVDFKMKPSAYSTGGDIEIWGDEDAEFEVALSAYSLTNMEDAESVTVYPSDEGVQTVELGRNMTGSLTVTTETSPLNGKPHVMITSGLTGIRNNYALALTVTPKGKGRVDIWADNTIVGLTDNDTEGFTGPATESTIAEIGGTAKRILTVGAYVTRDEYRLASWLPETENSKVQGETLGALGTFSSCGPTADGRLKPEVTAPGCFIVSAVSSNDASGTLLVAHNYSDATREYLYGYMQGTSMSAPFVTGTVATWLQACPTLTPEQLKEIVKATARHDDFTGDIAADGDDAWGYGKIDTYEGLRKCIELQSTGISTINAPFDGSIVRRGDCIKVITLAENTAAQARIYTADGAVVSDTRICGDTSIAIGTLPQGVYILKVTDGKNTRTVKFSK